MIIQGILYLDLSYNRIEKLEHTDLEILKHMSVLDLSHNNLKTLDYFVAAIPLPSKLNLAGRRSDQMVGQIINISKMQFWTGISVK